jgi:hypothetical protein
MVAAVVAWAAWAVWTSKSRSPARYTKNPAKAGFFLVLRGIPGTLDAAPAPLDAAPATSSRHGGSGGHGAEPSLLGRVRRRAFGAHPRCSDTPSRFVPERPLPRPMFLSGLRPLHLSGTRLEGGHRRLFPSLRFVGSSRRSKAEPARPKSNEVQGAVRKSARLEAEPGPGIRDDRSLGPGY